MDRTSQSSTSSRVVTVDTLRGVAALASFNSSVALVASLIIASVNMPELRLTTFFAAISYSLYLTHVPVGRSAVHLGMRVIPDHPLAEVALLLASTGLCIFVAYVSYRLFERPAQILAARIDYVRPTRRETLVQGSAAQAELTSS